MIRILAFVLLLFLNTAFSISSSTICQSNGSCVVKGTINDEIKIESQYSEIINYATFTNSGTSFIVKSSGKVSTFVNYGNMNTFWTENSGSGNIDVYNYANLNNTSNNGNFALSGANVKLYYFNMKIDENANNFNSITGDLTNKPDNERNSHILISGSNDNKFSLSSDAMIVLSFGDSFEIDKSYDMTKLILDCKGGSGNNNVQSCSNSYNSTKDQAIKAISTHNDGLYKLYKNANNLIVSLDTSYASANAIYKGNLSSINTIKNQLNQILYEKKLENEYRVYNNVRDRALRDRRSQRAFIESGVSDRYDGVSRGNRIQSQINESSVQPNIIGKSNTNDDNYFFFSPFISYQNIFDGGEYSGLGYGFISGYNVDLNSNHLLGLHFGFAYGGLTSDTKFNFKDIYYAGFLGLHYQYSFVDSMYLKLRFEVFYHYNTITKNLVDTSNPNSISPSVNIAFGKKWDNRLGIEGGIDYMAMMNSKVESIDGKYDKSLFNLAYIDINGNYDLKFGSWGGVNTIIGSKILITPYPKTTLRISGGKDVAIHENRYSIYANIGTSWQINEIVALNLNYLGIFGDRMMSNSGFFNAKVWW